MRRPQQDLQAGLLTTHLAGRANQRAQPQVIATPSTAPLPTARRRCALASLSTRPPRSTDRPARPRISSPPALNSYEKSRRGKSETGLVSFSQINETLPIAAEQGESQMRGKFAFYTWQAAVLGASAAVLIGVLAITGLALKLRHLQVAGQRGGVTSFRGARAGRGRQSVL